MFSEIFSLWSIQDALYYYFFLSIIVVGRLQKRNSLSWCEHTEDTATCESMHLPITEAQDILIRLTVVYEEILQRYKVISTHVYHFLQNSWVMKEIISFSRYFFLNSWWFCRIIHSADYDVQAEYCAACFYLLRLSNQKINHPPTQLH